MHTIAPVPSLQFSPPCGGFWTFQNRLTSPETTVILREIFTQTTLMLDEYGNGDYTIDGTGISVKGKFRARTDIKKTKKAKVKDEDGPLRVEEPPEEPEPGIRDESKWKPMKRETDWRRIVALMSLPHGWIADIRVYTNDVGEQAAVEPMLDQIEAVGLRHDGRLYADGGFNGVKYREAIFAHGMEPWIPWPRHQKNGIPKNLSVADVAALRFVEALKGQFGLHWGTQLDRELFIAQYNIRSKAETLFSVLSTDYGRIRTRTGAGPENEVLIMAICHNLKRLLQLLSLAGMGRDFR